MKQEENVHIVDQLVGRHLDADAADVDGPAVLQRALDTLARGKRRRRVAWAAVAAAVLVALALLCLRAPEQPRPTATAQLPAVLPTQGARAAADGLHTVGLAAEKSLDLAVSQVLDIVPEEPTPDITRTAKTLTRSLTADAAHVRGKLGKLLAHSMDKAGLLM